MNVFEFVGHHHVSLILIITFVVVFAVGVNVNDKLFVLSVHHHQPLVEYATAVLADGVAVSLILQVVVHAYDDHVLCVKFVHDSVGALGADISYIILLNTAVDRLLRLSLYFT